MTVAGGHRDTRRNWLCIAYSFPPTNRSGTHRTLSFVRHLSSRGWYASVLTVEATGEPIDHDLTSLIPETIDVVRTPCLDLTDRVKKFVPASWCGRRNTPKGTAVTGQSSDDKGDSAPKRGIRDWASRFLQTPDSHLGWYGPAVRVGRRLLRSREFDVIYSTSPCMTAHLIARRLSRSFGVPWVADFRDPWGDNPFRDLPYRSQAAWDLFLERRVLRDADHVICNTRTVLERLCHRLPFVSDKVGVIMNGLDTERLRDVTPSRPGARDEFVITHAGQFYGRRSPVPLLRALRLAMAGRSADDPAIRLALIGSQHFDGVPLANLVRQEQVSNHVSCLGSKSHDETLSFLAGSDAVVVMGATGAGGDLQVPNKLFECLALRRPILAAVSAANPSREILELADAVCAMCSPEDPPGIADAIQRLAAGNRQVLPSNAWSGVEQFDRSHRAAELIDIFDRLVERSGNRKNLFQATSPRASVETLDGVVTPADAGSLAV